VFACRSDAAVPWLAHGVVEDVRDVVDLDLDALARGEAPPSLEPDPVPLFLVCTNGRRDPCCAERGRPLARAVHRTEGDRMWECSHIGGDRFAGNLVCLPHGLFFGRVEPHEAGDVTRRYRAGSIDLVHFRGRSTHGYPIQAGEAFVRQHRGLTGIDDVRFVGRRPDGDGVMATYAVPPDARVDLRIRIRRGEPPRRVTCHAVEPTAPPVFDVVER
jgi:sucrase/ferredoxin-like protein